MDYAVRCFDVGLDDSELVQIQRRPIQRLNGTRFQQVGGAHFAAGHVVCKNLRQGFRVFQQPLNGALGANTVNGPSLFSVPTRPAACVALISVEN